MADAFVTGTAAVVGGDAVAFAAVETTVVVVVLLGAVIGAAVVDVVSRGGADGTRHTPSALL